MAVMWMPASPLGRYSLWAAGGFLVLLVVNAVVQAVMEPPGALRLALVWSALAAAVAAAVLALIAILRDKDRAILTFVAIMPALFALGFELIFE